jgi:hypothetical protein
MDHDSVNQWAGNILSAAAVGASLLGWITPLAAAAGLIWYVLQIYESATVQSHLHDRRTQRIAKLKARLVVLEAMQLADDKDDQKH